MSETRSTLAPETLRRITDHNRLSDIQEHESNIRDGIIPATPYNRDEIAGRDNGRSLRPHCNTRARAVANATRFQIHVIHREGLWVPRCGLWNGGNGSAMLGTLGLSGEAIIRCWVT